MHKRNPHFSGMIIIIGPFGPFMFGFVTVVVNASSQDNLVVDFAREDDGSAFLGNEVMC